MFGDLKGSYVVGRTTERTTLEDNPITRLTETEEFTIDKKGRTYYYSFYNAVRYCFAKSPPRPTRGWFLGHGFSWIDQAYTLQKKTKKFLHI